MLSSDQSLQFDSIEDTVKAFSECTYICPSGVRPSCVAPRFSLGAKQCFKISSLLLIANALCSLTGNGEFIIVLDSQDRENEGDLIIAAESITDAQMAFLVRYTRYNNSLARIS